MDNLQEAFEAYTKRVDTLLSALKLQIEHKDALILTLVKLVHTLDSSDPAYVLSAAPGGTAHIMVTGDGPIVRSITVTFVVQDLAGNRTSFGITNNQSHNLRANEKVFNSTHDTGFNNQLSNDETDNDLMRSRILPNENTK